MQTTISAGSLPKKYFESKYGNLKQRILLSEQKEKKEEEKGQVKEEFIDEVIAFFKQDDLNSDNSSRNQVLSYLDTGINIEAKLQ